LCGSSPLVETRRTSGGTICFTHWLMDGFAIFQKHSGFGPKLLPLRHWHGNRSIGPEQQSHFHAQNQIAATIAAHERHNDADFISDFRLRTHRP